MITLRRSLGKQISSNRGAACFISKSGQSLKITGGGQNIIVDHKSIVIKNECLNLKQYFNYSCEDEIGSYSSCNVLKDTIGSSYKISCSVWIPNGKEQFPDRIVSAGALTIPYNRNIPAFVRMKDDYLCEILAYNGQSRVLKTDYAFVNSTENRSDGMWRMATVKKYENGLVFINMDERVVPSARDAIVNGALLWDSTTQEYMYT